MAKVGRPIGKKGQSPAFTLPQLKSVFAVAKAGRNGLRNHAFLQLLFSSALRASEPTAFVRGDVEAADGSIVETFTLGGDKNKSGRNRTVFVNKSTREALRLYLATLPTHTETKLFPFSPNYASWLCTELCKKANLPTHSSHSFKRTALHYASDELGLQMHQLQMLASHSSPQTTVLYLNRSPKPIQDKLRNVSL